MHLLDLPEELLERIGLLLATRDVRVFERTCKFLHRICQAETIRYRLMLDVYDMVDGEVLAPPTEQQSKEMATPHGGKAGDGDGNVHHHRAPALPSTEEQGGITASGASLSTTTGQRRHLSAAAKLAMLTARIEAFAKLEPRPWIASPAPGRDRQTGRGEPAHGTEAAAQGEPEGDAEEQVGMSVPDDDGDVHALYGGRRSRKLTEAEIAQERWQAQQEEFKFTLQGETSIYECQDGLFLYTDVYTLTAGGRRSPRNIRLYPLPTADEPFAKRNVPTESRYVGLPRGIADLTLDPTQDLLVVAENDPPAINGRRALHRYHLLTLSTLEPHPQAKDHVLSSELRWDNSMTSQLLQVLGDVLAVLVTKYEQATSVIEEEMYMWNWRTGEMLAYNKIFTPDAPSSFVLLSPKHFLLTASRNMDETAEPLIEVYRLREREDPVYPMPPNDINEEGQVIVLTDEERRRSEEQARLQPVRMVTFHLPAFAMSTQSSSLGVRPDPPSPPLGVSTPFGPPKPFAEDYRQGILVFDLRALAFEEEAAVQVASLRANLFASKAMFLETALERDRLADLEMSVEDTPRTTNDPIARENLIGSYDWGHFLADGYGWTPTESARCRSLRHISWDEWGPDKSRLLAEQSMTSRQWVVNSSGWRYVTTTRGEPPSRPITIGQPIPARLGPHHVRVLDFSPVSVRRHRLQHPTRMRTESEDATAMNAQAVLTPGGNSVRLCDAWSTVPRGRIFRDNVVTRLPYIEITSAKQWECDGVMMDEQRIMLTKTQLGPEGDLEQEVTVLTF